MPRFDAISFDKNEIGLTHSTALTSTVDGKKGIFSCWFSPCEETHKTALYTTKGMTATIMRVVHPSMDFGCIRIIMRSDRDTIVLFAQSNPIGAMTERWNHVLCSWDLAVVDSVRLYVNDTDELEVVRTFVNDDIEYTDAGHYAFYDWDGGCVSDLYFNMAEYLDFDTESNRRKFIDASGDPVDLGSDGSTPTGTQPDVFFDDMAENPGVNAGFGGDFTPGTTKECLNTGTLDSDDLGGYSAPNAIDITASGTLNGDMGLTGSIGSDRGTITFFTKFDDMDMDNDEFDIWTSWDDNGHKSVRLWQEVYDRDAVFGSSTANVIQEISTMPSSPDDAKGTMAFWTRLAGSTDQSYVWQAIAGSGEQGTEVLIGPDRKVRVRLRNSEDNRNAVTTASSSANTVSIKDTATTTIADGTEGTFACWVYPGNIINTVNLWRSTDSSDGSAMLIRLIDISDGFSSGFVVQALLYDVDNNLVLEIRSVDDPVALTASSWSSILISWDTTNSSNPARLYIDDVDYQGHTALLQISEEVLYEVDNVYLYEEIDGGTTSFADLWFDPTFIEIDNPNTRDIFLNGSVPNHLGDEGQRPTGSQAAYYFRGTDDTDFGLNSGYEADFSEVGTVTTASTTAYGDNPTGGDIVLSADTNINALSAFTWNHVLISWDTNQPDDPIRIWINGSDKLDTATVDGPTKELIRYQVPSAKAYLQTAGGGTSYADLWFAPGKFLDFDDADVRARFVVGAGIGYPAFLGSDGSLPTGYQPGYYFRNEDSGNYGSNSGSEFDFNESGTPGPVAAPWDPFPTGDKTAAHLVLKLWSTGAKPALTASLDRVDNLGVETGWHAHLISWDLSTDTVHWYVSAPDSPEGVIDTDGLLSYATPGTVYESVQTDIDVFTDFVGCFAELRFDQNMYEDFTDLCSRMKFVDIDGNPQDLGEDGSNPGVQPDFYFRNESTSDPEVNSGSIGTFTNVAPAEITACGSPPTFRDPGTFFFVDGNPIDTTSGGYLERTEDCDLLQTLDNTKQVTMSIWVKLDSGTQKIINLSDERFVMNVSTTAITLVAKNGADEIIMDLGDGSYLISGQDETDFQGGGANGVFADGSAQSLDDYAVSDTILMDDGSEVIVDAIDGSGNITEFTITAQGRLEPTLQANFQWIDQVSTSGSGLGFRLYPDTNNLTPDVPGVTAGSWHHILLSFNMSTPSSLELYVDDVDQTPVAGIMDDDYIDLRRVPSKLYEGSGCYSMFWMDTDTNIDFSVEANRRKFIRADGLPADLGVDGSTPTAAQPAIFLTWDETQPGWNQGYAGDFEVNGTITDCADSPYGYTC